MKNSQKIHPMFFVCLVCGVIAANTFSEMGDSILAAGLEGGSGAVCGIMLFYVLAPFLGWNLFK